MSRKSPHRNLKQKNHVASHPALHCPRTSCRAPATSPGSGRPVSPDPDPQEFLGFRLSGLGFRVFGSLVLSFDRSESGARHAVPFAIRSFVVKLLLSCRCFACFERGEIPPKHRQLPKHIETRKQKHSQLPGRLDPKDV